FPYLVFGSTAEKYQAIEDEIARLNSEGRPVLVGTTSIEKSELISDLLRKRGIKHEVLNAKHHEREAFIVARAGQHAAVTIATNMAGRGTDIILGDGVAALGGLHVLGTERHEARRIDNQLRGRSGRQGDPGSSQFILSLEDDLLRVFAPEWVRSILTKLGMSDGQPLESRMVSRAIEKAQKRMEEHNFDIRKNLVEYDDVMNEQRSAVYLQRQKILEGKETKELTLEWLEDSIDRNVRALANENDRDRDDAACARAISVWVQGKFASPVEPGTLQGRPADDVVEEMCSVVTEAYEKRESELGPAVMREIEKFVLLDLIDERWKEHLYSLEHLRSGIGLRGYAQVDPKVEYKREGFALFDDMIESVKDAVASRILRVKLGADEQERLSRRWAPTDFIKRDVSGFSGAGPDGAKGAEDKPKPIVALEKTSRNALCPCGSGKKFKRCCGR
ncbi:MAG: SEC-C metal-binding domain-containing protein, partial [Planctomycetota bacterium]|nr:SEC-C metal-binding domain-containing protein [Planctomycetota bacterium]